MSIQLPTTNQPQRQYAQPGGIRVSLGSPIRFIALFIMAAIWAGLTISFLGFPSEANDYVVLASSTLSLDWRAFCL
jgi:hypothetical protein